MLTGFALADPLVGEQIHSGLLSRNSCRTYWASSFPDFFLDISTRGMVKPGMLNCITPPSDEIVPDEP